MGGIGDLFTSPRERAAPGQYEGQMGSYDDILNAIKSMQSSNAGVTDLGTLKAQYGLTSASAAYDPARRALSNRRGKALSSTSARLSSRIANPEAALGGVESGFASAAGDLESEASKADIGQQDYIANLLNSIRNQQDQYGFQKQGMRLQGQGAKGNAISDYLQSLSGASSFDDILALGGTVSKFYNPFSSPDKKDTGKKT
jgi:hypothetical protein